MVWLSLEDEYRSTHAGFSVAHVKQPCGTYCSPGKRRPCCGSSCTLGRSQTLEAQWVGSSDQCHESMYVGEVISQINTSHNENQRTYALSLKITSPMHFSSIFSLWYFQWLLQIAGSWNIFNVAQSAIFYTSLLVGAFRKENTYHLHIVLLRTISNRTSADSPAVQLPEGVPNDANSIAWIVPPLVPAQTNISIQLPYPSGIFSHNPWYDPVRIFLGIDTLLILQ